MFARFGEFARVPQFLLLLSRQPSSQLREDESPLGLTMIGEL